MSTLNADRLRVHPTTRFAAPERRLHLPALADTLRHEPTLPRGGHRQRTIYKHGSITVALFVFEPGALLADHVADGSVLIQVLRGWLQIRTPDQVHELRDGDLLVLASGTPHDVHAVIASQMLLTVQLDKFEVPTPW